MKVICYGDSNTYGYDPRSYIGRSYPAGEHWVDLLAEKTGWEVENRGMNGKSFYRLRLPLCIWRVNSKGALNGNFVLLLKKV